MKQTHTPIDEHNELICKRIWMGIEQMKRYAT